MREVEVLQDRLLALFESDPALLPRRSGYDPGYRDLCPLYSGGLLPSGRRSTVDSFQYRRPGGPEESQLVDSFLSLLDLCSRMGVSQVLAILESPAVQRRFGLAEADLELIHRWVRDTRIRWGIDEESRKDLGLPEFSENTWRAGLDRMLLGCALPGQDEKMFMGILPYDLIEGSDAPILGKFLGFMDRLFDAVKEMNKARSLEEWGEFF